MKLGEAYHHRLVFNRSVKTGYKNIDTNFVQTDNSNVPDNKWNFVVHYFNSGDRIFTQYVEMADDVHVCERGRIIKFNKKLLKTPTVARVKTNHTERRKSLKFQYNKLNQ